MNYRIGVVVATYNGALYIKEQLSSIINQSMKPDIIIVTDGGSKDKTVSICEDILSKSNIVYRILTSNMRLNVKDNFERGVKNCAAEYIFFSDQDDFWLPDKIQDFMRVFDKEQADMIFSNAYITDDALLKTRRNLWETIGFTPNSEIKVYDKGDIEFLSEIIRHNIVTGMCMAISEKMLNKILPFSRYAIRDVWIAHVMNYSGKIVALNKCEVLYRQHANNIIGTHTNLRNSFNHRYGYYERIQKRVCFIEEIKDKCCDKRIVEKYEEYIAYLLKRISFVERKIPLYRMILYVKYYRKFEHKWRWIFMKDFFIRLTSKKRVTL